MLNQIKEKDTKEETIADTLSSFSLFGMVIFFLLFFYMGALNGKYPHNSPETYFNNTLGNYSMAFGILYNKTVVQFYNIGYEKYNVFFYLWWVTIIFWFYQLISDLFKWFKQRKVMKGGTEKNE